MQIHLVVVITNWYRFAYANFHFQFILFKYKYPYGVERKNKKKTSGSSNNNNKNSNTVCYVTQENKYTNIFNRERNKLKKEANKTTTTTTTATKNKKNPYSVRCDAIWRVATFFLANYVTEGRLSHASTFLISRVCFHFLFDSFSLCIFCRRICFVWISFSFGTSLSCHFGSLFLFFSYSLLVFLCPSFHLFFSRLFLFFLDYFSFTFFFFLVWPLIFLFLFFWC